MSSGLIRVARNILREAVKFGIEEAGTRICGSGWSAVKQVLTPAFNELERRYPKMFLVDGELQKAEKDLESDQLLAAQIQDELAVLKEGHTQIMEVLVRHDETLETYRDLIIRAINEANQKNQARHEAVIAELAGLKTEIVDLPAQINAATAQPHLAINEIFKQANGYQMDAMKWISAQDPDAASQRLAMARSMAISGLKQDPDSALMMVTLGFVEKTQAQVAELRGKPDDATEELARAAKYFVRALEIDNTDINALHGMANVYYFGQDYDTAIQLEMAVIGVDPLHGPALNDLSLALEEKLKRASAPDDAKATIRVLILIYEMLEKVMPSQPQMFPASYLVHVQKRRAELKQHPI